MDMPKRAGPKEVCHSQYQSYKSNPDNHHNIFKRMNYDSWAFKPLLPQEHSQLKLGGGRRELL